MKLKNKMTKFFDNSNNLVGLTAYSTDMATILDKYVDFILVGDSLGMTVYGMQNTRGVTLDMMINHGKAVVKGSKNTFLRPIKGCPIEKTCSGGPLFNSLK